MMRLALLVALAWAGAQGALRAAPVGSPSLVRGPIEPKPPAVAAPPVVPPPPGPEGPDEPDEPEPEQEEPEEPDEPAPSSDDVGQSLVWRLRGTAAKAEPNFFGVTLNAVEEFEIDSDNDLRMSAVEGLRLNLSLGPNCKRCDLLFTRFPLASVNGRDYFIGNYLDLDKDKDEKMDYRWKTGAEARTYDGHKGIDVSIPSFRQMDDNSALIRAAAPGVVTFVRSNQPDRNIGVWCPDLAPADRPTWNVVVVRADNGWKVMYGHMKRNSPRVAVGDRVSAGTVLGVVGSSGCSTGPHLHMEVRDCNNKAVETFRSSLVMDDMWINPPAYEPAANVMDVMIKKWRFSGNQLISPPPDRKLFKPGDEIGVASWLTYENNDVFNYRAYSPQGLYWQRTYTTTVTNGRHRKGFAHWWWTIPNRVGQWRVEVRCNGLLKKVKYFKVSNYSPYRLEIVVSRVPHGSYQQKFVDVTSAGYRPHIVDGYNVLGGTYINAVFRKYNNGYRAHHGLTAAGYQNRFNTRPHGYRPIQVESYLVGNSVRYALILKRQGGGAWAARHGLSDLQWTNTFNALRAQGYSPIQISVVSVGGQRRYTTYWEKRNIGSWYVHSRLRLTQYQAVFNAQRNLNRRPLHLNAYVHNGVTYISCIFASAVPAYFEARHGMTQAQLTAKVASNNAFPVRRLTQTITGYQHSHSHRFAAVWFRD